MLDALRVKVGEVYKNCIGENEANIKLTWPLNSLNTKHSPVFVA